MAYRKKLEKWARKMKVEGKLPLGVSMVNVYHDDWCDIYKGLECSCEPDITFTPEEDREFGTAGERLKRNRRQ
jgi:hypothetical protein